MVRIEPGTAEAVSAYVAGWTVSRGTPAPKPVEFGWYVPTGTPHESERYVPVHGSVSDIIRVAASLELPSACLKFAGDYEAWRPVFGAEWIDNPVGWFMTADLSRTVRTAVPVGTLRVHKDGDLITASIRSGNNIIASGRVGMAGSWCVPDRIRTSEPHRRTGLGRTVMHALLHEAHAAGARRAVLDASEDGKALYTAMGWTTLSPQFGLTRTGPTQLHGVPRFAALAPRPTVG